MDKVAQLEHRIAMIADDLKALRVFITQKGLTEIFQKSTNECDEAFTHLNNIEIACDLTTKESLAWRQFRCTNSFLSREKAEKVEKVKKVVQALKDMDVDGETMEDILEKVGMDDQMHRQLVMGKSTELTMNFVIEKVC